MISEKDIDILLMVRDSTNNKKVRDIITDPRLDKDFEKTFRIIRAEKKGEYVHYEYYYIYSWMYSETINSFNYGVQKKYILYSYKKDSKWNISPAQEKEYSFKDIYRLWQNNSLGDTDFETIRAIESGPNYRKQKSYLDMY